MLTHNELQPNYCERIIRAKNGRLVRVCFLFAEIEGEIRGKIVSVQPVFEVEGRFKIQDSRFKKKAGEVIVALPVPTKTAATVEPTLRSNLVVSPFSSQLIFFMSQPTRAPAGAN